MRRVQLMVSDTEYDQWSAIFYDGMRGRVIRNLMNRACEAVQELDCDITTDDVIRGDFKLIGDDRGDL